MFEYKKAFLLNPYTLQMKASATLISYLIYTTTAKPKKATKQALENLTGTWSNGNGDENYDNCFYEANTKTLECGGDPGVDLIKVQYKVMYDSLVDDNAYLKPVGDNTEGEYNGEFEVEIKGNRMKWEKKYGDLEFTLKKEKERYDDEGGDEGHYILGGGE